MADTPISGLNAISGSAATAADEFAVVNAAETKKISLAELKTALTKDGLAVTGNLSVTGNLLATGGIELGNTDTNPNATRLWNAAGFTYFGVEGVAGGEIASGSLPYSAVVAASGAQSVDIAPNLAVMARFSQTGLEVNGNLSATGTRINFANLPTSATGLTTGDLWNDAGTLKIAP